MAWALAAVFLVAAIAGAAAYLRLARAPVQVIVSEVPPPLKFHFTFGLAGGPLALSPGGHALAFTGVDASGTNLLWVRPLNASVAQPLNGTEAAGFPFWSEDGRSIGFGSGGKLKTIDVSGGPATVVANAPHLGGGTWSRQGAILFVPDFRKGLYRVAASGGTPVPVMMLDPSKFQYYLWPQFLPDGKHFLYLGVASDPQNTGIYFATLGGNENRLVLRSDNRAVYASGGLLYGRGTTLVWQAFDPHRGQLRGEPRPVAEPVNCWRPSPCRRRFSV